MSKWLFSFLILLLTTEVFGQDYWPMQPGQISTFRKAQQANGDGTFFTISFDTIVQKDQRAVGYFNLSKAFRFKCQLPLLKTANEYLSAPHYIDSLVIENDHLILYNNESTFRFPRNPKVGQTWLHNNQEYNTTEKRWYSENALQDSVLVIKAKGKDHEMLLSKHHGLLKIEQNLESIMDNGKGLALAGWQKASDTFGIRPPTTNDMFQLQIGDVLYIKYRSWNPSEEQLTLRYYKDSVIKANYTNLQINYTFSRIHYNGWGHQTDTSTRTQSINIKEYNRLFSLNENQFQAQAKHSFLSQGDQFLYSPENELYTIQIHNTGLTLIEDSCEIDLLMDVGNTIRYFGKSGYPEFFINSTSGGETSETLMGSILNGVAQGKTDIPTSMKEIKQNDIGLLYPNPSSGVFYLEGALSKAIQIQVFSATGRIVYDEKLQSQQQKLNLTDLPKGTYILRLSGLGYLQWQKLVIQR